MTNEQRNQIIKESHQRCLDILNSKGVEYSRGEIDVNSNFKRVGEAIGVDPLVVCYTYLAKHWDSLSSFVKTRDGGTEGIQSRLADLHNYLYIFESILEEKDENTNK